MISNFRIKDGCLCFDTDITIQTKKKMTGHSFVELCGFSNFRKKGDTVLSLLGAYKETVDPKYLRRGDFAENIARAYYKRLGKNILYYSEEDKKANHYDFYQSYLQCGGIPDIKIPEELLNIEVKSKSLSKYDSLIVNLPKEEVYQGLYYAYLDHDKTNTMFYVFFDEESEKAIFEGRKPETLKNVKIYLESYPVNQNEMKELISSALKYYNTCIKEMRIPLKDISQSVLDKLGFKREYDEGEF